MNKKIWDETLTRATTGMNLEDMMLSEISQTQQYKYYMILGVPGGPVVKNLPANPGNEGSIPGSRRSPGSRNSPVFLPGEFHGQRSLAGYSPWGHKKAEHD